MTLLTLDDLSAAVAHLQHTGEIHPEDCALLRRHLHYCRREQQQGYLPDYNGLVRYPGGRQVLALLEYDQRDR